jgi:hypothetical protein
MIAKAAAILRMVANLFVMTAKLPQESLSSSAAFALSTAANGDRGARE